MSTATLPPCPYHPIPRKLSNPIPANMKCSPFSSLSRGMSSLVTAFRRQEQRDLKGHLEELLINRYGYTNEERNREIEMTVDRLALLFVRLVGSEGPPEESLETFQNRLTAIATREREKYRTLESQKREMSKEGGNLLWITTHLRLSHMKLARLSERYGRKVPQLRPLVADILGVYGYPLDRVRYSNQAK